MIELIGSTLSQFSFRDCLDILLATFIIYQLLQLVKGTRGWQVTLGVLAVLVFFAASAWLELRVVLTILTYFFTYSVFALIVIFQAELRRGLAELGQGRFYVHLMAPKKTELRLDEIVLAATTLSSKRIGALIVIEREIGLRNYVEGSIKLDAHLSYDLLVTIFNPSSPIHDGAVIIQGDRLSAASCFLPLTTDPYLSKELGTRHRAAMGITEESDAVAIVVSEETGTISVVINRELQRNLDGPRLLRTLKRALDVSGEKQEASGSGTQQQGGLDEPQEAGQVEPKATEQQQTT